MPQDIATERLRIESDNNMSLVKISMMETVTTQLRTENYACKNYQLEHEFNDCAKDKIWSLLRPSISCTIIGLEAILPSQLDIWPCQTLESALKVFEAMLITFTEFLTNMIEYGCPVPCSQKSFNYNIKYLNRNSWIESQNSTLSQNMAIVAVSYRSLLVEERVETIVYDLESLMTSIGGNLGLFLGFSCFSTFLTVLKFIFKTTFFQMV